METEKLYKLWAEESPQWETRFEETLRKLCDYGGGANQYNTARGKIFGAGYELYIVAFFIGLYSGQAPRPLINDKKKRKDFRHPIKYWGNLKDGIRLRKSYPEIREYMFIALIAKTDIDFIALDKGEITSAEVVKQLITNMEGYANIGFHYIEDKLVDNPDYFYNPTTFLELFLSFCKKDQASEDEEDEELESLE